MKLKDVLKTATAILLSVVLLSCGGGGGGTDEPVTGISGRITIGGVYFAGVTVTLSGTASATTTTDSSGYYLFTGLANGDYTITPTKTNCTFTPTDATVTYTGSNITQDFTATVTPAIAAGGNHSLALKSDGTVWAWGNNGFGQLGQGTTSISISVPTYISSLSGIIAIAAGEDHSLALRGDGTVWAWGHNNYGQLGQATTSTSINTPTHISSLSRIIAIAAGGDHSLALTNSGSVKSWGAGTSGQIGDGYTVSRNSPVDVINLTSVVITAIAAGGNHSLALTSSGNVKAWGAGTSGQIGDGYTVNRNSPVDVINLTSVVITAIAAGGNHSLALTNSGSVKSWGFNTYGQLGQGTTTTPVSAPGNVINMASITVTDIAAGGNHSLALTNSGSVKSWGYNNFGQLGQGTSSTFVSTPGDIINMTSVTVTDIKAGGNHSLSLTNSGGVKSWGYNNFGQLGRATTLTYDSTPDDVNSF